MDGAQLDSVRCRRCPPRGGSEDQLELLERLRAGDPPAFAELVDAWSPMLLRGRAAARLHPRLRRGGRPGHVARRDRQLDRFEGRSSLRTWVFRILENQARSRGVRESRTLPWSSAFGGPAGDEDAEPTVAPSRFRGPDDQLARRLDAGRSAGCVGTTARGRRGGGEVRRELGMALDALPPASACGRGVARRPRALVRRGVRAAGLTPGNQRILLHRGRARLRAPAGGPVPRDRTGDGAHRG